MFRCLFRRRQWHPTPLLLPGKSHGWRSLVGCSSCGHEELDMTEWLHFHFHALEKEMATHSSVLAWRIPGSEEPGGLLSVGSHRVRHDWSDLAAAAAAVFVSSPRWKTASWHKTHHSQLTYHTLCKAPSVSVKSGLKASKNSLMAQIMKNLPAMQQTQV